MTKGERRRKMHAVLDGEATPEETREVQALLGSDAQAREEYAELEGLFAALRAVPQAHAPEGLLAAATSLYEQRNQLSTGMGVIGDNRIAGRGASPERSIGRAPAHGERRIHGGVTMSMKTGNRKLWIGGVALAVVAIAVSSRYIEFPGSGDATSGAITPAQRHRAAQPTAAEIKLANPGTPVNVQGSLPTPPASAANAAENAAQSNAQGFAQGVAQGRAQGVAQGYAQGVAQGMAQGQAQGVAQGHAQGVAQGMAQGVAQGHAQGLAQGMAQDAAKSSAQGMAHDSAKASAQGMVHDSAKASAQGMAHDSAKASAQGMAHDSAKASAQGMAHDSAKSSAQGMAKDSAKASAQGMAKDSAKSSAQGMAKDSAKASAQGMAHDAAKATAQGVAR